jgi:hypothetical protein
MLNTQNTNLPLFNYQNKRKNNLFENYNKKPFGKISDQSSKFYIHLTQI